jgi:cytochrome c556
MPTTKPVILTLACLLLAPVTGHTEQPAAHHDAPPPGEQLHLTPALTDLLKQEMNAIQQGMQTLHPAIVSGNWHDAAAIGEKIQQSYIMQQQLTAGQMDELHHKLPPDFLELDQSFHHAAGMLAHAARQHNTEVVNFYYYKLTDTCIACHRKFALHRFPGLADAADNKPHQH